MRICEDSYGFTKICDNSQEFMGIFKNSRGFAGIPQTTFTVFIPSFSMNFLPSPLNIVKTSRIPFLSFFQQTTCIMHIHIFLLNFLSQHGNCPCKICPL